MKKLLLFTILLSAFTFTKAAIVTPYPETIELKQINGADKERIRLAQGHKKYDKQATGFYVSAGDVIEVNLEILTPAAKDVMPVLTVGTLGFNVEGRNTGEDYTLTEGVNRITNHPGGLIWLSFTHNEPAAPTGVAKITFTENSQHERAPHYVYGVTTDTEFYEMYQAYKTPDVVYTSDYIAVVATRMSALQYSVYNRAGSTVLKEWMEAIHLLLELEDDISGLDNNDPNPVHHRLKAGEIRFLLVENTSTSPHASGVGYTGYPHASRHRYLTKIGVEGNNTWMLGHELGHQHQQPAYQIDKATESTVNIYSYVVERNIQGSSYNRTTATRWAQAQNTYLSQPISKRLYNIPDDDMEALIGFNRDELRFMPWEQMFLIFGDQFYKTLHRVTREEKITGGGDDERRAYLIWKASQVSGYDLTEFYNQWGIRVTDAAVKAKLRARIGNALKAGTIEALPRPAEDFVMLTGQNRPAWSKLPVKGITSSQPDFEKFDRSDWTITTSYQGASDNAIGGDNPYYIIDGATTCFSFVKPGKNYNNITPPTDYVPSFTIDMKEPKLLNYVEYKHRSGNNSSYIRARQFSILGSNDGENFSPIVENYAVDYVKNETLLGIETPEVTYRYIKFEIENWDKDNGSTIQVEEVDVSHVVFEELPTPDPIQFKVNVEINEAIDTEQAGENWADEDSMYRVRFSLNEWYASDLEVFIDGVKRQARKDGDEYFIDVKITNHTDVQIKAKTNTGVTKTEALKMSSFPNPVKAGSPFVLKLNDNTTSMQVEIYNLTGSLVLSQKAQSDNNFVVNEPGLYIVKAVQDKLTYTMKLIVE